MQKEYDVKSWNWNDFQRLSFLKSIRSLVRQSPYFSNQVSNLTQYGNFTKEQQRYLKSSKLILLDYICVKQDIFFHVDLLL